MIKVSKRTIVPKILEEKGKQLNEEICAAYLAHRKSYKEDKKNSI